MSWIPGLDDLLFPFWKAVAYLFSILTIVKIFWKHVKCGVIKALCYIVDLLWQSISWVAEQFVTFVQGVRGGTTIDFTPYVQYAKYVNCLVPLDVGAVCVALFMTFLVGFLAIKVLLKFIPTMG